MAHVMTSVPGNAASSTTRLGGGSRGPSLAGQRQLWRHRQHAPHGRGGMRQVAPILAFRSRSASLQEELTSAEVARPRRITALKPRSALLPDEAARPKQALLLERGAQQERGAGGSGGAGGRLKAEQQSQQPLLVSSNVAAFRRRAAGPPAAAQKRRAAPKGGAAAASQVRPERKPLR